MHGQLMRKLQRKPKQGKNRNTSAKSSIRRLVLSSSLEISFEFSIGRKHRDKTSEQCGKVIIVKW